mmetsp:Transcript_104803/g.271500  ORF Transcript_104803/g.271500 Transcript_104803/m.271500 type:complete len:343 (+) Transcript_104803:783-1811(+)
MRVCRGWRPRTPTATSSRAGRTLLASWARSRRDRRSSCAQSSVFDYSTQRPMTPLPAPRRTKRTTITSKLPFSGRSSSSRCLVERHRRRQGCPRGWRWSSPRTTGRRLALVQLRGRSHRRGLRRRRWRSRSSARVARTMVGRSSHLRSSGSMGSSSCWACSSCTSTPRCSGTASAPRRPWSRRRGAATEGQAATPSAWRRAQAPCSTCRASRATSWTVPGERFDRCWTRSSQKATTPASWYWPAAATSYSEMCAHIRSSTLTSRSPGLRTDSCHPPCCRSTFACRSLPSTTAQRVSFLAHSSRVASTATPSPASGDAHACVLCQQAPPSCATSACSTAARRT